MHKPNRITETNRRRKEEFKNRKLGNPNFQPPPPPVLVRTPISFEDRIPPHKMPKSA